MSRPYRVDAEDCLEPFDELENPTEPLVTSEVADAVGIARRTALKKLTELEERGLIESKSPGPRTRIWYRPYHAVANADRDTESERQPTPVTDDRAHSDTGEDGSVESDEERLEMALDRLDKLPETQDPQAVAAAVGVVVGYLREHGPAGKTEIVEEVMPEVPLGYDLPDDGSDFKGAWWRKVVRPALDEIVDEVEYRENHRDYRFIGDEDAAGAGGEPA